MADPSDPLAPLREEIDRIDSDVLRLLNRRAECALAIGEIKKQNNQPIHVPERERHVLDRMAAENRGPLGEAFVRSLFQTLFDQMKRLENGGPEKT